MYVCTAARRPYALEAWRLLDPDGALIPSHRLARRLCNIKTGQKKSVLATLGLRRATQEDLAGPGEGIDTRLCLCGGTATLGMRRAQEGGAAHGVARPHMLDLGGTGEGLIVTLEWGGGRACWPQWACGGRRREGRCMACWTWVAQVRG